MKPIHFHFFLFAALVSLGGCIKSEKENQNQLFQLLSPDATGVHFSNNIVENDTFNAAHLEYIYNGGGVAVGDINNDGLQDLYFAGNQVPGRLYLNKGNLTFEDITEKARVTTDRWTTGVSLIDINNDGYLDIYLCATNYKVPKEKQGNLLFINNKNNTFTESAVKYGIADVGYNTHAAFLDYDKDGDLDLYVLTNALEDFPRNNTKIRLLDGRGKSTDKLYRNNGNGTFTNVSKEAGILIEGWGLGVAVSDINQDGWPDIYVANDFLSNDLLYINNKNGTFTNKIAECMKHQSHNGMGTDIADYNNDGYPDVMVLDMLPEDNMGQKTMFSNVNYDRFQLNITMGYQPQYMRNTLQLNNGNGTFSEVGQMAGVYSTNWSWSPLFADFDNDGQKDLFITNGYRRDVTDLDFIVYGQENNRFGTEETKRKKMYEELQKLEGIKLHNYIFRNKGDLTFEDKSLEWGLDEPSYSNGAVFADLDNDGDLDIAINNLDAPASIYRNNSERLSKNHFLRIRLKGTNLNPDGIGAKVQIRYNGKKQFLEQIIHKGFKSSQESSMHFGLGSAVKVDSLEILWPDGKYELIKNIQANTVLVIDHKNALESTMISFTDSDASATQVFHEVSKEYGINYKHEDAEFIDFKVQPLVPHKHSQNGPGIAVGDIDGNGMEDFYVGGGARYPGGLFMQMPNGKFKSLPFPSGDETKYEEDMGVLFFDADNDKDLDLYVVSGGTEYGQKSKYYQDRLYRNNGKGKLALDTTALPEITASGSCVTANDFDKDGDLDLFVGGRVIPGKYPLAPQSYLLRNEGGKFSDATAGVCKELQNIGMVSSAIWSDFDNDTYSDLILVGEGMPITFLKNSNGKLVNVTGTAGLPDNSGWWNSIAAADFDNDGDMDYVAGNLGLNTKFRASEKEPVCVYAKDFDQNGSVDPVLCSYLQGKNYPVAYRDQLFDQMVSYRRKFPRYADYGSRTFEEIFPQEELKDVYILRNVYLKSSYIENKGGGKFVLQALPMQAQVAPVFGILADDYDHDGNLDLLLTGNSYAPEVQSGWYDAMIGVYLQGDGKGNFKPVDPKKSGFFVDSDAKGIAEIVTKNNHYLTLVASNADSLKVFSPLSDTKYTLLKLQPDDAYAIVTFKNSAKRKQEFYYGSSYLSQSSRTMKISDDMESVIIFGYSGKSRKVK